MRQLLFVSVLVLVVGCGESATTITAADAGTDAAQPAYDCCVEGKSCTTSAPIRWCAAPDAGPAGRRCILAGEIGCYVRVGDGGPAELFSTTTIAPRETWPEGIVECSDGERRTCL